MRFCINTTSILASTSQKRYVAQSGPITTPHLGTESLRALFFGSHRPETASGFFSLITPEKVSSNVDEVGGQIRDRSLGNHAELLLRMRLRPPKFLVRLVAAKKIEAAITAFNCSANHRCKQQMPRLKFHGFRSIARLVKLESVFGNEVQL